MKTPITYSAITDLLDELHVFFPPPEPMELEEIDLMVVCWSHALSPLSDVEARQAARLWIMTGHRSPTPADVLGCAATLRAARVILDTTPPTAH